MSGEAKIELSIEEREELERLVRSSKASVRSAERARIVLLIAEGGSDTAIAKELNTTRQRIGRWRNRFARGRVAAIMRDMPRGGRPRQVADAAKVAEIIELTTQTTPQNATHWSTRTMAARVGVSDTTVLRVWRAHGLKPHLLKGFKVSNDPAFVEKLEDIVGLYLSPPEHALVLCCDEKSQVQALDRTQPGLPLKKGRAATHTHDYKRHGTTTLFAALNILDGQVIASCKPQHRHEEWLQFLRQINANTPRHLALHLVCDNYATHKHPNVKKWLAKHPRFHIHFTPTSASWLNMVERFFRSISVDRLKRGVFHSVAELEQAINEYIAHHNREPKPFIWTAKANDILQKVVRAKAAVLLRSA